MRCPSCGNEVPARPVCLRCGATLFGDAALPPTALGPIPVPLTAGQKVRLLAGSIPLFFFALMVAGYLVLVGRGIYPFPPLLFWIVIGLAILAMGYDVVQSLRDVISGTALVQEDLLNRSYRSRGAQGRSRCYGKFERLGTLRMSSKLLVQHAPGRRYRVFYSPVSKRVWALEPPDQRIRE